MQARVHPFPKRNSSVQEDWSAWLPILKAEVFEFYVRQFDTLYNMFSVALDEALELRRTGNIEQSYRAVIVIPALCDRLARPLEALLNTLGEHAKHFGTIPKSVPLGAANFRGSREQHSARMSELLSRVLFTQRSQFLHKIDTLDEMVLSIRRRFHDVALDLSCGASLQPSSDWRAIDDAHFDLNTCLREAIVLLKSFLVVLPEDQLGALQKSVNAYIRDSEDSSAGRRLARRRRMVPIEGE